MLTPSALAQVMQHGELVAVLLIGMLLGLVLGALAWLPWRWRSDAHLAQILAAQLEVAAHLEAQVAQRTQKLRQAKEWAERADMAKGEFLARVSHELRTPLHTILGYVHLLRRDSVDARAGERLVFLEESGRHLAKLVDDLLDYACGERGQLVLQLEATFVHRLLARLGQYGVALADPRRHCFECHFGDDLPDLLHLDAARLEQVVLILLSNAMRYTPAGRITLAVQNLAAEAGTVRLGFAVTDSGPGIAAGDRERIFDPFVRSMNGQNVGGLGLGLAIGRQIVGAMGGVLTVDSAQGQGSRFWFEVELALAREEDIPPPMADLDLVGYAGAPRRILVVEDCAANRRWLEQLLVELGFVVHGAESLDQALAYLALSAYDLVLLDQRLPDGTAWDILRALRQGGQECATAAVLMSAQPAQPPLDWGPAPGFDGVLLKPVSGREILLCLGELLGLTWQQSRPSATLPPGPVGGALAAVLPSPAACAELAAFARQGAVYEIEAWLARLRMEQAECGGFCREVAALLAALDFQAIVARVESTQA